MPVKLYEFKGQKYTLDTLKQKYNAYIATSNSIINKATAEKRSLNDAELKDYDGLEAKINDLSDFFNVLDTPAEPIITFAPNSTSDGTETKGPAKDRTFKGMFYNGSSQVRLNNGGFKNFNEFLTVLDSGRYDPRLQVKNVMTEGAGASGGFAVPEEFAGWLLDSSLESEIVRPRATIWPMKSETRLVPAWDGFDHSSNVFGGFSGVWLGEAGTATRQNAKLRLISMKARKLAIFTQASRELIDDGLDFEAQLGAALTSALGWYMDDAFINGDGVGKPIGLLKNPSLITVNKETGQAADTITYENCTKMFARLHPSCIQKAVWIVNQTAMPQLLTMSIAIGTGGSFIPAVTQSDGKMYLMGKEILFTEKCPPLGDAGDIILADLSKYAVGIRQDLIIDKSNIPGWLTDAQDYRIIARVDGLGTWAKAVTPANGDTLSWCVTLAERS